MLVFIEQKKLNMTFGAEKYRELKIHFWKKNCVTKTPEYSPDMSPRPHRGVARPTHVDWWKTPWRFQDQEKQRMRRTKRARRQAAGAQQKLAERRLRLDALD
jgi:hypothetical protein